MASATPAMIQSGRVKRIPSGDTIPSSLLEAPLASLVSQGTGIAVRTSSGAFTSRILVTGNLILTNSDGVAGNITINAPQSLDTTNTPTFAGLNFSAPGGTGLAHNFVDQSVGTVATMLYAGNNAPGSKDFAFIITAADSLYFYTVGNRPISFYAGGNLLINLLGTGYIVMGGAAFRSVLSATAALDFGSIAAGSQAELTISVTGAAAADAVHLGLPAGLEAGLAVSARVSATDTVTVRLINTTGSAIDPASGTYRATVIHY
jgi:hypothetical protein